MSYTLTQPPGPAAPQRAPLSRVATRGGSLNRAPGARRPFHGSTWADTLHVAVAHSNPLRWQTRGALIQDYAEHLGSFPGVQLHLAELAYGDRPFEATRADNPLAVQLRTTGELWHKENLLNLAIRSFPPGWKYGMVCDGDLHFTRHDWVAETIHQLQHHPWVQPYSCLAYLRPDYRPHRLLSSFAYNWVHNRETCTLANGSPGALGGMWAFTHEGLDAVGSLLECCILGSGDYHMTWGLAGRDTSAALAKMPAGYRETILSWQERAHTLQADLGVVNQMAVHYWHGMLQQRGYGLRDEILVRNAYTPVSDVRHDSQGVLTLSGNKPTLRDDIRAYFRSRNEDASDSVEQGLV